MLTREILSPLLPHLHPHDKVYQALELMGDNQVAHLPVAEEGKFLGIISEDDLLQAEDDQAALGELQGFFLNSFVNGGDHFTKALQAAAENELSTVPVVDDEGLLLGIISYIDILKQGSLLNGLQEPGGLIVLQMERNQYSFSEISKLVEGNDTQITQLNTQNYPDTGIMQVTLRINKPDVSDIVAAFQRHEYTIMYFFGEESYTNELKSNYDNLMNYLKI